MRTPTFPRNTQKTSSSMLSSPTRSRTKAERQSPCARTPCPPRTTAKKRSVIKFTDYMETVHPGAVRNHDPGTRRLQYPPYHVNRGIRNSGIEERDFRDRR